MPSVKEDGGAQLMKIAKKRHPNVGWLRHGQAAESGWGAQLCTQTINCSHSFTPVSAFFHRSAQEVSAPKANQASAYHATMLWWWSEPSRVSCLCNIKLIHHFGQEHIQRRSLILPTMNLISLGRPKEAKNLGSD